MSANGVAFVRHLASSRAVQPTRILECQFVLIRRRIAILRRYRWVSHIQSNISNSHLYGLKSPRCPNTDAMLLHTPISRTFPHESAEGPESSPTILSLKQMPFEPLRLRPQQPHRIEEQLIALRLTGGLDTEDEMISNSPQLHFALELVVA